MTGGRSFTWRLAAFLVLTLGLLAWTLQALGAFSFASGYSLRATFDDASGLLVGSEVQLSGVPVGRVERIDLSPDHRAIVTMTMHKDLRLSVDTTAEIRARSMLGEKLIALASTTRHDSDLYLFPDGEIQTTSVAADMNSLAATAGEAMGKIEDALAQFGEVAESFGELRESVDIDGLLADLRAVGDLARSGRAFLDEHGDEVQATMTAAREGAEAVTRTAEQARAPLAKLDELLAEMHGAGTIQATAGLVEELSRFTSETGPEVRDTLRTLRESLAGKDGKEGLTATVGSAATTAEEFFTGAQDLTNRLKRTTASLERTLSNLDRALDNVSRLTPREIRKILQEEGVRVILLD